MTLLNSSDTRPVHFMGIAGAGMSALAQLLAYRGVAVSGCDSGSGSVEDVERLGIRVERGHDPLHVEDCRALVVTAAVPVDHPEVTAARQRGLPVVRRADALAEVTSNGILVAVAGTHGKTTTTAMTTEALAAAGRDPTGLAGGRIAMWKGNVRPGRSDLNVVEADEYDRAFLSLKPHIAVVTNVEPEHLDIYGDEDGVRLAFEQFLRPAKRVVFCADDPGAASLTLPESAVTLPYGVHSERARLTVGELSSVHGRPRGVVLLDGVELGELSLRVPGVHNFDNALAALACGLLLGASFEELRPGIEAFEGVERRFQLLGTVRGIAVVDDYAHHPTEVRATLDAARAVFPGRRLVCAFQPHLYSRTRDFASEFGRALASADVVLLTEIYPAREAPIPGVTSALIEEALREQGRVPLWRGAREDVLEALGAVVQEGDVVLTLGAGDITLVGRELLRRLALRQ